jgi:hypothetical protein
LLFILVYLKTYALQVVQGRLFGRGQSKADQCIHVLLVVLQATLRTLGDAPTRSLTELAQRLRVAEADAAAIVVPPEELPTPTDPPAVAPTSAPVSPLWALMGLSITAHKCTACVGNDAQPITGNTTQHDRRQYCSKGRWSPWSC